ncbi:MAG: S-layer homology domain-containing protein [bacterium]
MKKHILAVLFLLFSTSSYALVSDAGIDPLDQTSGAKPLSLGGAFVGASDDMNCLFYNPAGIAHTRGMIVSAKDIKNFSLGAVYDTGIGNFGVGAVYKSYGEFDIADALTAKYEYNLALLSYGIGSDWLSVGFAVKSLLSQRLSITGVADKSASIGTDYDAGVLWKPVDYASIGMMIRNISGAEYKLGASEEALPRSTRVGLVLNILGKNSIFRNEEFGLKAAYDAEGGNAGSNQKQNSFYGLEGSFNGWLFARLGGSSIFKIDGNVAGSSLGLGIKFKDVEVNLASLRDPLTELQISYLSWSYSPREFALFRAPEAAKLLPPARKALRIDSPQDEYVTYDDRVVVSGVTTPKASILINGVRADVGDDGKFSAVQRLISGKNLIEIIESIDHQTKTVFKKVLRKAKVIIKEETGTEKKIAQEVLNKEVEIAKKEEELKRDKKKGIDVSQKEKVLIAEKAKVNEKKEKLLEEKKKNEERKEKVENLVTLGVIEVSPGAQFEIEAPITRGEMLSWLVKASGMTLPKVDGAVFADVPQNHKFAPAIKAALNAGLISGGPGGKFRPDDPVKEEEGQAFFRAFGVVK